VRRRHVTKLFALFLAATPITPAVAQSVNVEFLASPQRYIGKTITLGGSSLL